MSLPAICLIHELESDISQSQYKCDYASNMNLSYLQRSSTPHQLSPLHPWNPPPSTSVSDIRWHTCAVNILNMNLTYQSVLLTCFIATKSGRRIFQMAMFAGPVGAGSILEDKKSLTNRRLSERLPWLQAAALRRTGNLQGEEQVISY